MTTLRSSRSRAFIAVCVTLALLAAGVSASSQTDRLLSKYPEAFPAIPLDYENGAEIPAPLGPEDFYQSHQDEEIFLELNAGLTFEAEPPQVIDATTTVSQKDPAPTKKAYTITRPNVQPDDPQPECPRATCPSTSKCAHGDGATCCGDHKHCCPAGTLCVTGGDKPMCVKDNVGDGNRCTLQRCKSGHKCPHLDVQFCCLGGISCCDNKHMCTTKQPATCTLKKQFQMLAGQPDKSDITVQRKFPVDQDQVDAVAQAKKTAELNAAWLSQEKADQVAELKQKKVQEESEKNDRLKKMTPKEKAAYDEAKSKANKDAVLYELNDDKALRRVKAGNGKRELDLELTSGTSLVGGALRFDCPNTVGARAESSRFADMFDFGNKDFTITARVLTRVDGPQKRFIYKRSKDEDQPGYSMMIHNNTVAFQYGRNQTIYGSSKVNDGEFHSIVVVRDTSNHEVRLYVDDQLQARAQDLSTSITNDGQFVLGGPAFNGTGFCGYLKDIGLFKRVLSKTEITEFTSDRDSKDSMTRIRNEALLSEAAQAAKEAEQSLQRSKQEAERADYKAEQEHKDKNQQAKAAVARREEQNAQAQLKQVENDWEKAQQVARTATNEANREQALWIARNLKEKMTLAEKAYDMAAEASEKEGQKAIRISIEKTKATAAEQTAKAEAAEQRAKKIKKASDLEIQAEKENCHTQPSQVGMISKWDFNGNLRDSIGALHGTAVGGAVTFENGGVLVDKGKYIKTELLTATLKARTLEVWCKLDRSLGQSKAGVMSVQTQDGSVYDSVAYGHGKKEKIWYAASNGDARTEPTPEGAPEKEDKETIHVAVTYDVGGVAIYRNGLPYRNYSKGEIASFNKDNGQILFGTMHGNGTASGHFKGTIVEARLYNRALTPTEIATSFFAYTQCPAIQASIAKDKAKKELAEKLAAESKLVAEKEVHSAKAEGLAKKHEADKLMKRSEQREKESEKNRKRRDKVEEVDTKNHLKKRHTMCRKTSNKSPSSNAGKWSWPVFSYRKGWNFVKSWSFNSRATVVGDFNGDGRSDYARLGGTYMHLFISRGDGTFWQPVYKFPKGWNFRHDESVWTTLKAIDLNGDKRADIVRLHYNSNKAFISAGSNNDCFYRDGDIPEACFRVTSFRHKVAFQGPLSWNDDKRTVVGDFNSDGRGDFARVGPNFIHFFISKGDGTFFTPSYEMPTGVNIGEKDNQWSTLVGNFNGNCQTSFIFTSGTFQHALLNVGTDLDCWNQDGWLKKNANCFKYMTMAYPRKWNISGMWTFNSRATLIGDFNADGFDDFARVGPKYMHLFINKGNGQFYHPVYRFPASADGSKQWDFTFNEHIWTTLPAADFDGDGRTDIVRTYYTYNHGFFPRGSNELCWHRDDNIPLDCFLITTFYYPKNWHFSGDWGFFHDYNPIVGDFNGDGKDDFINLGGGTFNHQFISL